MSHESPVPSSEPTPEDLYVKRENLLPITDLYRGEYADVLNNGDLLPVGGSMFISPVLDIKLKLDFDKFEEVISKYSRELFEERFAKVEPFVKKWLEDSQIDIDPRTYLALSDVLANVEKVLKTKETGHGDVEGPFSKRNTGYRKGDEDLTKLSETVGVSACGERAALGQYMLQKIGISSSYMSGVRMDDAKDDEAFPENHSVIVIHKKDADYVFDIARPYVTSAEKEGGEKQTVPRIMKTATRLEPELFKQVDGKKHDGLLVECEEVLTLKKKDGTPFRGRSYFGVGVPVAGSKEVIDFDK